VNCNKCNLYADEHYFPPQLENMLMNSDNIAKRILLNYGMKFFYVKLSTIIITYQWCFGSFIPLPSTLKLNASEETIDIYTSLFNIFLLLLPRNLDILSKPS
jgi:hypothetical protein